MKPEIGAVFANQRGRTFEVVGHMLSASDVVVRGESGLMDVAAWPLMTPENGWHRKATAPRSSEACPTVLRVGQRVTLGGEESVKYDYRHRTGIVLDEHISDYRVQVPGVGRAWFLKKDVYPIPDAPRSNDASIHAEIEAHDQAVALIVAHKVQWCRARLMHVLASACTQGTVLEDVLEELLPEGPGRGDWDGYETGGGIAGAIEQALRENGWLGGSKPMTGIPVEPTLTSEPGTNSKTLEGAHLRTGVANPSKGEAARGASCNIEDTTTECRPGLQEDGLGALPRPAVTESLSGRDLGAPEGETRDVPRSDEASHKSDEKP